MKKYGELSLKSEVEILKSEEMKKIFGSGEPYDPTFPGDTCSGKPDKYACGLEGGVRCSFEHNGIQHIGKCTWSTSFKKCNCVSTGSFG